MLKLASVGTVLANEEVINGLSERGDHPVVRRPLRQWMLRITAFASALERDLEGLQWPEGTMQAQRRWIGQSKGAIVRFPVTGPGLDEGHCLEAYTTRPDTLLGVTYLVVAPEHPLVGKISNAQVQDYVSRSAGRSDVARVSSKDKSGVSLGCHAQHPITGAMLPVWCADYVLGGYGTGAVMAVPAHDQRDYEFAGVYGLPVKRVVQPSIDSTQAELSLPFTDVGIVCNSGEFDGLDSDACATAMINKLAVAGAGEAKEMYKLHDWVFSRQRYWGEAIPIYFPIEFHDNSGSIIDGLSMELDPKSPDCKYRICYETPMAVDESELPLQLPAMEDFSPRNDPQGCLAQAADWRFFKKDDGRWYARETSTMPQVLKLLN